MNQFPKEKGVRYHFINTDYSIIGSSSINLNQMIHQFILDLQSIKKERSEGIGITFHKYPKFYRDYYPKVALVSHYIALIEGILENVFYIVFIFYLVGGEYRILYDKTR